MSSHKQKIAYHEAGHAVVARILGIEVPYVSLLSLSPESGGTAISCSAAHSGAQCDTDTRAAAFEIDAMVSFAGPTSQQRFRPLTPRKQQEAISGGEWWDDYSNAHGFLTSAVLLRNGIEPKMDTNFPDDYAEEVDKSLDRLRAEMDKLDDKLRNETADLVLKNWAAIERVANELLQRPVLNQDDLDKLIANSPFNLSDLWSRVDRGAPRGA